jgi:2-dehydro-3-deoxyphosphogluconate aldolase/(4S)-4-hydroxy-2-oxoglutarate aldolase
MTSIRSKNEILAGLTGTGVVAVVRAPKPDQVPPLAEALLAGGVCAIEITMTTPNALEVIRDLRGKLGPRALVGVGTVLNAGIAEQAIAAGAEFVVSPIMRPDIARAAQAADRPVMLGAFTPTEAQAAFEAGSDFIKIFPSDVLGAKFIKAILAPLPHLRIIPTGIAKPEDVTAFIQAGCVGVGLGSMLIPQPALRDSNWVEITRLARQFVGLVAQARQKP